MTISVSASSTRDTPRGANLRGLFLHGSGALGLCRAASSTAQVGGIPWHPKPGDISRRTMVPLGDMEQRFMREIERKDFERLDEQKSTAG